VSPVKYKQGFHTRFEVFTAVAILHRFIYIPEDIVHSHRSGDLKSYIALTGWALQRRRNVFPVKYELGFYIPGDDILHSHSRENLKCYKWS
jgi:hypothetical protein